MRAYIFHFSPFRGLTISSHAIKVEDLQGTPLYFAYQGDILIETGTLMILKRVTLNETYNSINALKSRLKQAVDSYSNKTNKQYVDNFEQSILERLDHLNHELTDLHHALGLDKRVKRGLFYFVGHFHRFAFGTMDDHDRNEIKAYLDLIAHNEKNLEVRSNNSIAVMEGINLALKSINRNQNLTQIKINDIIDNLKLINLQSNIHINMNEALIHFLDYAAQIQQEITNTRNALQFFSVGVLDSHIASREDLTNTINNAKVGYSVKINEINDVLKTCEKFLYADKDNWSVYVGIKIPVTNYEYHSFYDIISIPQSVGNHNVRVANNMKHYVVNTISKNYWIGDNINIHEIGDKKIAKIASLIVPRMNESCENDLFNYKSDALCRYEATPKHISTQKVTTNGMIIIGDTDATAIFSCMNSTGTLVIPKTALISDISGCSIFHEQFRYEVEQTLRQILMRDIKPPIHNHNFSLEWIKTQDIPHLQLEDINSIDKVLAVAKLWIRENPLKTFIITSSSSIPTIIVIIIIMAVIKYIRDCRVIGRR